MECLVYVEAKIKIKAMLSCPKISNQEDSLMNPARRQWLLGLSSIGAAAILVGCGKTSESRDANGEDEETKAPEVTATEDLMREHGVLRRALLVYQESTTRLRDNAAPIPAEPLQKTAKL